MSFIIPLPIYIIQIGQCIIQYQTGIYLQNININTFILYFILLIFMIKKIL